MTWCFELKAWHWKCDAWLTRRWHSILDCHRHEHIIILSSHCFISWGFSQGMFATIFSSRRQQWQNRSRTCEHFAFPLAMRRSWSSLLFSLVLYQNPIWQPVSQIDTLWHVNGEAGSYELARFELLPSFGPWKTAKGEWTKLLLARQAGNTSWCAWILVPSLDTMQTYFALNSYLRIHWTGQFLKGVFLNIGVSCVRH